MLGGDSPAENTEAVIWRGRKVCDERGKGFRVGWYLKTRIDTIYVHLTSHFQHSKYMAYILL